MKTTQQEDTHKVGQDPDSQTLPQRRQQELHTPRQTNQLYPTDNHLQALGRQLHQQRPQTTEKRHLPTIHAIGKNGKKETQLTRKYRQPKQKTHDS